MSRHVFCGQSDYPSQSNATMNRYMAIARAIGRTCEVVFLNRLPVTQEIAIAEGPFQRVNAFGRFLRPDSFLVRNVLRAVAPVAETLALVRLNKQAKIHWVHIYTQYFMVLALYWLVARVLGFRTVLHCVEKRSEFQDRSVLLRLNDQLFERFGPVMCDRFVAISHSIMQDITEVAPQARCLIVPPVCDFPYIAGVPEVNSQSCMVYCGSAAYEEVIEFVVRAFCRARIDDWKLLLVINGALSQRIESLLEAARDCVEVRSKLPYEELIGTYKSAAALLVPLRNTPQDTARFPQKICEYVAARSPIVTTNVGEMPRYFRDGVSAIVCDEYSIDAYAGKLSWVMQKPQALPSIADAAYELGLEHFDIAAQSRRLSEFLAP